MKAPAKSSAFSPGNLFIAMRELLFLREIKCAFCGDEVEKEQHCVCSKCAAKLPKKPDPRRDIDNIPSVQAAFSYDEPIRSLIHRYKYDNSRFAASFFAHALANLPFAPNSYLCAVPLHPARKKERGFSQTEELCAQLSYVSGIPRLKGALIRTRNTPSQTTLNAEQRAQNLERAFEASTIVKGKRIIVVDDVATTGSTLSQSALALKNAGCEAVYGLVIAY